MSIAAIAFDVDGTLYDYHDQTVHASTIRAARQAKQRGITLMIATARSYAELNTVCQRELGIEYFITASGSSIVDSAGCSLYAERFTAAQTERLIALAVQYDVGLTLKYDGINCLYRHADTMRQVYSNIGEGLCPAVVCAGMDYHKSALPIGFTVHGENGARDRLAQALAEYPRDYRLELFRNGVVADIFLPHVSKLTALRSLCGRLGIPAGQVMTFGDSVNDIEMTRWAGLGVAMGNGREELKQAADHVCAPGWEDGIARAIERFALTDS